MDAHKIIKIIEIKSRDRIALPQEARERLNVKEGEYVAILEDSPGIRVVKVKLDLKETVKNEARKSVSPIQKDSE